MSRAIERVFVGGSVHGEETFDIQTAMGRVTDILDKLDKMNPPSTGSGLIGGGKGVTLPMNFMELDINIMDTMITSDEQSSRYNNVSSMDRDTYDEKFRRINGRISHMIRLVRLIAGHKRALEHGRNSNFDMQRLHMMEQMMVTIMHTHRVALEKLERRKTN